LGAPEGPCTHGGRCPPFLHGLAHPPCPPSPRGRGDWLRVLRTLNPLGDELTPSPNPTGRAGTVPLFLVHRRGHALTEGAALHSCMA